jgi:hypothetical protein
VNDMRLILHDHDQDQRMFLGHDFFVLTHSHGLDVFCVYIQKTYSLSYGSCHHHMWYNGYHHHVRRHLRLTRPATVVHPSAHS